VPPARFSLPRRGGAAAVEVEVHAVATESGLRLVATTSTAVCARATTDGCQRFGFTSRENEVARLVCGGNSNPEIGRALGIALRTVENHLRSIYAKAQVSSRTQLAARLLL
jgi:DNA-binding CsgD family transcriptional regulator